MDRLEKEFASKGIRRGGILFLRPADAIELVSRCKERNIPLYGIDGFALTKSTTQPFLEHSISLDQDGNSYEKAKRFLEGYVDSGLYFEVVYAEQGEAGPISVSA